MTLTETGFIMARKKDTQQRELRDNNKPDTRDGDRIRRAALPAAHIHTIGRHRYQQTIDENICAHIAQREGAHVRAGQRENLGHELRACEKYQRQSDDKKR